MAAQKNTTILQGEGHIDDDKAAPNSVHDNEGKQQTQKSVKNSSHPQRRGDETKSIRSSGLRRDRDREAA